MHWFPLNIILKNLPLFFSTISIMMIRLYDLSETLEIIGKQLSNNQIKDIVSQSFNMVQQMKKIFGEC